MNATRDLSQKHGLSFNIFSCPSQTCLWYTHSGDTPLLSWMRSMQLEIGSSKPRKPWWRRRGLVSVVSEFRSHPGPTSWASFLGWRVSTGTSNKVAKPQQTRDSATDNGASTKNVQTASIIVLCCIALVQTDQSELDCCKPTRHASSVWNLRRTKMNAALVVKRKHAFGFGQCVRKRLTGNSVNRR